MMKKTYGIQVYSDGTLVMPSRDSSEKPDLHSRPRSETQRMWRKGLSVFLALLALASLVAIDSLPLQWALKFEGWTPLFILTLALQCLRILFEWLQYKATGTDKKRKMEFYKVAVGILVICAAAWTFVNNYRIYRFKPIRNITCEFDVFLSPVLRNQKLKPHGFGTNFFLYQKDSITQTKGSLNLVSINAQTIQDKNIELTDEEIAKGYRFDDKIALRLVLNGNHSKFDNRLRFISANEFFKDEYYLQIPLQLPPNTKFRCSYSISINNEEPLLNADPTYRNVTEQFGRTVINIPLVDTNRVGK